MLTVAQYNYCLQQNPCYNQQLGNYTISGQKWYKHELKYIFLNGTNDIPGEDEKNAFYFAFNAWSNAMPFIFTEVFNVNEADIKIKYETTAAIYSTGASESAIAVSYQPEQTCKGLILLNDEYHGFSLSPYPSGGYKDLYSIAIHELGHVLGLCHSNNSQTVMYFDYQHNKRTLHTYDIQGIQAIYDKVTVKDEFKNPNGSISNGGIINVEFTDYNTDNLTNQEKLFAFNKNSPRRFEAKEQTFQGIDRKFNSYTDKDGGWIRGFNTIIGTMPILNTSVITATYKASYRYKTNISVSGQMEFDGTQVLSSTQIWQYENGQISAPSQQTINGRTYNFAGWTDGNGDNPRTIWPDNNQTYTALYKMVQKSNDETAYANNSQRKFVRTSNGYLHCVYENNCAVLT